MASTPTQTRSAHETETERRLVNCYPIHDLHWFHGEPCWRPLGIADGDPDRALADARKARADGLLIVDVRTGERWFVDIVQMERADLESHIRFAHAMDDWHREQGYTLCWCRRWIAADDLYEGTCGDAECLRAEWAAS